MTILETGQLQVSRNKSTTSKVGFTLLEVILVIALVTIASSFTVANFITFLSFEDRFDPQESLRAAIRSARFQAAAERTQTAISYDKKSGTLLISSGETFPLSKNFCQNGSGNIRFYLVPPAEGMDPFQDSASTKLETKEIRFSSDRSSTPFIAEIDNGQGESERLIFDPFSSLVRNP